MKQAVEFMRNGASVKRYHTLTTLIPETVGHHSAEVAILCTLLSPNASANLLRAALYHDLAECVTGDLPSPAKKQYGIGEQVSALEDKLLESSGLPMPALTAEDARTLKLADIAQGALYCCREIALGNAPLRTVFARYMSYADAFVLVGREAQLFNLIKEQYDVL